MHHNEISINGRVIGCGHPVYIVAEMSANHNHSYDHAEAIIRAAKEAGADAVKLQTYSPETMTIDCENEYFKIGKGTIWEGRNLYELYDEAYTPWEWQPKLIKLAEKIDIHCFSTPFDPTAVDFLENLEIPAYKVASFELVDLPLLKKIAQTGKPVIMSTGMASLAEIDEAVNTLRQCGCKELALLKCSSAYPALPEEMNLRTISHLSQAYDVPVGLSDHTLGYEVSIAAVSLGASIIEKHFTISREIKGPDSAFSLEPGEFNQMVNAIRNVEKALGKVKYETAEKEQNSKVFRRSLFVVENIKSGEDFTLKNVRVIRPGFGLHPRHLDDILGRRAKMDIERGTPLNWNLIV
jgi:pseudaminic acid synthase